MDEHQNKFLTWVDRGQWNSFDKVVLSLKEVLKETRLVDFDKVVRIETLIAQGRTTKIFKASLHDEECFALKVPVALKRVDLGRYYQFESTASQINILSSIGHRNIVNLVGACYGRVPVYTTISYLDVLFEYCHYRDLSTYLQEYAFRYHNPATNGTNNNELHLTPRDLVQWTLDLSNALQFLHEKKIVHGDVSLGNIFLDKDKVAKLSCFGVVRKLKKSKVLGFTWGQVAKRGETGGDDIYRFGVTLFQLFSLGGETEDFLQLGKPLLAPQKIYEDVILTCLKPKRRLQWPQVLKLLNAVLETSDATTPIQVPAGSYIQPLTLEDIVEGQVEVQGSYASSYMYDIANASLKTNTENGGQVVSNVLLKELSYLGHLRCTSREEANELRILKLVGVHANILKLIGVSPLGHASGKSLKMIFEGCLASNLRRYLRENRDHFAMEPTSPTRQSTMTGPQPVQITTKNLIFWALDIVSGMERLHSKRVIHCDLTLANICVGYDGVAKIGQFYTCVVLPSDTNQVPRKQWKERVSWRSAAPETNDKRDPTISLESDIWMYGVLLFELFSLGAKPFEDAEKPSKIWLEMVKLGPLPPLMRPPNAPLRIYNRVMRYCWRANREDRIKWPEIREELVEEASEGGVSSVKSVRTTAV